MSFSSVQSVNYFCFYAYLATNLTAIWFRLLAYRPFGPPMSIAEPWDKGEGKDGNGRMDTNRVTGPRLNRVTKQQTRRYAGEGPQAPSRITTPGRGLFGPHMPGGRPGQDRGPGPVIEGSIRHQLYLSPRHHAVHTFSSLLCFTGFFYVCSISKMSNHSSHDIVTRPDIRLYLFCGDVGYVSLTGRCSRCPLICLDAVLCSLNE